MSNMFITPKSMPGTLPEVKPLTPEQKFALAMDRFDRAEEVRLAAFLRRPVVNHITTETPKQADNKSIVVKKIDNNGWTQRNNLSHNVNWDKAVAKSNDFTSNATSGKQSKKSNNKKGNK